MSLKTDLESSVDSILAQPWSTRVGQVVPASDDVALAGGGVGLDATVLYADLARSTILAWKFQPKTAAKILKSYLYCVSRLITANDGSITSFDGDRVMGIFLGNGKNSAAAKAALQIKWAVDEILKPRVMSQFVALGNQGFVLQHATGVDTSEVLAVRAGMRGSNDLIWVGRAPGIAAKLSDLRETSYRSYITEDVYGRLNEKSKLSSGTDMWVKHNTSVEGLVVYKSSYHWTF